MNTPDDESGDELTREYQRASDAQAGSPAAATRAAILAEARAAALRRTPAANDSRYVWRAVAGIAVLGVAVLLWRQVDRKLTPDLAVSTPERTVTAPPTPAAAPEDRPALPTADKATAEPGPKDEREVQSNAPAARIREEASGNVSAAADAAPSTVQLARAGADAVAPIQAAGAIRKDGIDYQQLLQREFPEVWNGIEPPHTVWVVVDANGRVLRKGELSAGATVTPDQPFETQKPWQMVRVTTASGSSLQLAVLSVN
jgi:hypothetical protein